MRESMETFVRDPGNAEAVQALASLNGLRPLPLKLFIEGPHRAGKSTLVRGWAEDAARAGEGEIVFACSGADIAMALQFEADDSFFDKLGAVPVLLVDDLELLLHTDKGDQLLSLMLAERDRLRLHTILTSRTPLCKCGFEDSLDALGAFETVTMMPLENEGKRAYVRMVAQEYGSEKSPMLSDEVVTCIIEETGGRFVDMENATRYLVTDEDCASMELDTATVKKLLHA